MKEIRALHENIDLDEMLALHAYKTKNGWFVNVSSWVSGENKGTVIGVPLNLFEKLIEETQTIN